MAQRYSASQIRSKFRQAEQKQRRAVNDYNRAVKRRNEKVKRSINDYNRDVRAYNARVRANRQRLKNEVARLNRRSTTQRVTYTVQYQTSVRALHDSYRRLEADAEPDEADPQHNRLLDLSERETANGLEVFNRIAGDSYTEPAHDELEHAELRDGLRRVSVDLDNRWQGAVFALNPRNPDAARHFCTSAREILGQILETAAPNDEVVAWSPACERTDRGDPIRRVKIRYLLHRRGMLEEALEDFVEKDMDNIVQLFHVLSSGTHGPAGALDGAQLDAVKKRVEDGIMFLTEIVVGTAQSMPS